MGFSGQEHWSELPCPPPGSLPNSGIKPASLTSPCIGRWVPYHLHHLGSPKASVLKIVWKFPDRYLWHESHISACNSLSTNRMRGLTGISNTTSPGLSSLSSAPSPVLPKASPQWPVLVTVLWFCTLIRNSSAGPASFQVFPEPDPSHPRCLVRHPPAPTSLNLILSHLGYYRGHPPGVLVPTPVLPSTLKGAARVVLSKPYLLHVFSPLKSPHQLLISLSVKVKGVVRQTRLCTTQLSVSSPAPPPSSLAAASLRLHRDLSHEPASGPLNMRLPAPHLRFL